MDLLENSDRRAGEQKGFSEHEFFSDNNEHKLLWII